MAEGNPTVPIAVIIDDDADIRHLLDRVLTQSGFETVLTANATDGVAAVREFEPLVTMLDVSMPGMDGFAAARKIREFSGTYVVMLTALADEIDVIQGLGSGADDYLLKPFRPRELRARIETLLRRPRERFEDPVLPAPSGAAVPPQPQERLWTSQDIEASQAGRTVMVQETPAQPKPVPQTPEEVDANAPETVVELPVVQELTHVRAVDEWIKHDGLAMNNGTGAVLVDGKPVDLNGSEFALLATLIESGRRVRSTANLVLTLRGESYVTTYYVNDADKSAVKAHMTNLRRKLGDTGPAPKWIESVRGVGYRMTSD